MKQKLAQRLAFFTTVVMGIFVLGLANVASAQNKENQFQASSLAAATTDETGVVALKYTQQRLHVLSGRPEVLLVQLITGVDLLPLGLPEIASNHPLALVIIKGDIDVSGAWPGSSEGQTRFNYIEYVFDLQTGVPTLIQGEITGDVLTKALDESARTKTTLELPVSVTTPLPEGVTAPTVVPTAIR